MQLSSRYSIDIFQVSSHQLLFSLFFLYLLLINRASQKATERDECFLFDQMDRNHSAAAAAVDVYSIDQEEEEEEVFGGIACLLAQVIKPSQIERVINNFGAFRSPGCNRTIRRGS